MTGIELITKERQEQIVKHGFTVESDCNKWKNGELLQFAQYIILTGSTTVVSKITTPEALWAIFTKPRTEQLAIAGALIAAEIDRRIRLEEK